MNIDYIPSTPQITIALLTLISHHNILNTHNCLAEMHQRGKKHETPHADMGVQPRCAVLW
jgi:hypothetical protein